MAPWPRRRARCTSSAARGATPCAWCAPCKVPGGRRGAGRVSRGHHGRRPHAAALSRQPVAGGAGGPGTGAACGPALCGACHREVCFYPSYQGDETLVGSVWRTLSCPAIDAVVHFGRPELAGERDRRAWRSTCTRWWMRCARLGLFTLMRCDQRGQGARRQTTGCSPSEAWQRRAWPFGRKPEGTRCKPLPLVVTLLAKAPALASSTLLARFARTGKNSVNRP